MLAPAPAPSPSAALFGQPKPPRGQVPSTADTESERTSQRQVLKPKSASAAPRIGARNATTNLPLHLRAVAPPERAHTPTARLGTERSKAQASRRGLDAVGQHPDSRQQGAAAAVSDMTRVEYSQRLKLAENSEAAGQARAEKEERKRFADEQKEKMRLRARELREQQLASNRPMEAVARAASRNTSYRGAAPVSSVRRWHGAHASAAHPVHVVDLGTVSSMERNEIKKRLQRSPRLGGW